MVQCNLEPDAYTTFIFNLEHRWTGSHYQGCGASYELKRALGPHFIILQKACPFGSMAVSAWPSC